MLQTNKFYLIGLLCLLFSVQLQSQVKCIVESYTTENGLSHDGVMDIIKGKDGFMWFGSWDGLNRFDGTHFINYKSRPGYNSKLESNRINKIKEDNYGYLWVRADDNQIYRFDKKKETFMALSDLIENQKKQKFLKIIPRSGNVWLTTEKHGVYLVRYKDSVHVELSNFSTANKTLNSNTINFVYEQKDKSVWIGTSKGLLHLKKDNQGKFVGSNYFNLYDFTSIQEGKNKVWFTTKNGNLIYFDKGLQVFHQKKVSEYSLRDLYISEKVNAVYMVSSEGELIKVNASTLVIESKNIFEGQSFYNVYEDKRGLLWIEPKKHGVVKFDPKTNTFKSFRQKNDATFQVFEKSYDVFEDGFDRLWVRMKGGGFGYYDEVNDKIHHFYNKNGQTNYLDSNIITYKYLDPSGVLWVVTNDKGINKIIFQRDDFKHHVLFEDTDNKTDNEIRGVLTDSNGRLWMASKSDKLFVTKNGVEVENLFVNYPNEGIKLIYVIYEDRKGNVWIGTKGHGLYKAEPLNIDRSKYKLTQFTPDENDVNSISGDKIYTVFEDKSGNIWTGNYGTGINLIIDQQGKTIFKNVSNSFKNYPINTCSKVRYIHEDQEGNIWIATTNGLLIANPKIEDFDDMVFDYYRKSAGDPSSIPSNDVLYIYKDLDNNMWLSCSGGGLSKVIRDGRDLKFKTFTTKEGLSSDFILSMVEDQHKNLWMATENGISKLNLKDFTFRNYDSYDGLYNTRFSESSCVILPNNNLLFGCIKGYLVFDPDEITDYKIDAKMSFTKLEINNKEVDLFTGNTPLETNINYNTNLKLNYTQNTISINYQVLDYRSNNKQIYVYRLRGFDETWQNVQNEKKATYTNLSPGDYVFEVKCLNDELYLNTPKKALAISIVPPFWKTTWAYLGYILVFLMLTEIIRRIVFSNIRLRNKVAVEQKLTELKLNFFTNISHELRTPLTLIVNPLDEIAKDENLSPRGQEYMAVVRKNTNRMVRFVNQLLDFRKMQSGKAKLNIEKIDLVLLVNQIASLFTEAAYEKQIDLKVISNTDKLLVWIDAKKIDIVIYNLLSNAFKFSPNNKKIVIEIINNEDNSFVIKVKDQGIGVADNMLKDIFKLYFEGEENRDSHIEGTGIGLALSKEYIKLHEGEIFAENNEDGGLTVTVNLESQPLEEGTESKFITTYSVLSDEKKQIRTLTDKEKKPSNSNQKSRAGFPKVLVVEDNNELRMFLANQLSESYQVIETANGAEGFEKATELMPDLILSDIMMPVMDGITFLDKVKNNETTSHIPIVLLTAKTTVETKIEALNYGADFYITKPFDTNYLKASIKNLLKSRQKMFNELVDNPKTIEVTPKEIVITTKDEAFLKEVISTVEEHMGRPDFNIDTFAKSINMPRATFNRKFKSLTNMTAVEFVRDMRLKRAKQMLDAGESNVSEVAFDVGFNSAGYFSTCFKEKFNISPSEYIKKSS